jgi:hypothetical protein
LSLYCPKCNGVVYDRRRKTCGFCGAELPPELLFSATEIEALNRQEAEAEQQRLKRKAKADAEEQERQKRKRERIPPPIGF